MPPTKSVLEGDVISKYPPIPASRDEDLVISRSKRPALGGQTSAITLHPDGKYTVTGPDFEVPADTRAEALRVARVGPEAAAAAAASDGDGGGSTSE